MVKIYSKALDTSIEINRIIGHIKGKEPGPTLIFIAGVHGNEPSGVFALYQVLEYIRVKKTPIKGSIYAIAGNLGALEVGVRYKKEDLNRMWTDAKVDELIHNKNKDLKEEAIEQQEIFGIISEILESESGPFYFIDLHTTSSPTKPFITVNDTLLNRKFTQQFPVPLLLGIEEYLEGTLLNNINQLGYVAFGFESGQHDALSSIKNHEAFIYLTLVYSETIGKTEIDYANHYDLLVNATKDLSPTYEIVYHHKIGQGEDFQTKPGFTNFEPVRKGQHIATSNNIQVLITEKGNIFMPLYQKQGEDGFFIIKAIPALFLSLSTVFRKLRVDHILPLLPGVSWVTQQKDTLKVDLRVARFMAKKLFHLMGYRSRQVAKNYLIAKNREATSKNKDYVKTAWYGNR
ncbi:MAG: aspartoacylase [Pricia sp.]|nr:aspartoacylase [Pricia sp.]